MRNNIILWSTIIYLTPIILNKYFHSTEEAWQPFATNLFSALLTKAQKPRWKSRNHKMPLPKISCVESMYHRNVCGKLFSSA
jgi:hypothetical protein